MKRINKILLALLLLGVVIVGVKACGGEDLSSSTNQDQLTTENELTEPELTVGDTVTTTDEPIVTTTQTVTTATTPETTSVIPETTTTAPETTDSLITDAPEAVAYDYVLNTSSKKFHYPDCMSAKKIKDENREEFYGTKEELIMQGYDPCGNCDP